MLVEIVVEVYTLVWVEKSNISGTPGTTNLEVLYVSTPFPFI